MLCWKSATRRPFLFPKASSKLRNIDLTRTMSSVPSLNPTVKNGFASSANYDKHRPTYVQDAVNYLLESLNVSERKNAKVVDMAAGTGKFTKILVNHRAKYEIAAVEPHGEMSKVLAENIANWGYQNVKNYKGDVLEPGIEKHWADAIVIAQVRWLGPPCVIPMLL